MPVLTTVIDDKSPLITYDATWLPGSAWDDPLASCYYLGTFTTNNVTNGAASFDFNGTAVWIYGAERTNHGSYSVEVDGQTYSGYNGAANNFFQQVLFNLSTLSQGTHSVKLTNTASNNLYVDIDMVQWQSEIGSSNDQLFSEIVQDTDSRWQYQEPAWVTTNTNDINLSLFSNGSGHLTQTYSAGVTFTFEVRFSLFETVPYTYYQPTGHAVSIFGTSGPVNGQYSAQLDGGQSITYNATNAYPTNYGVMIYYADNLGSGAHQITLTNLPSTTGQFLAIDYAQLWTTNSTSATSNGTVTPSSSYSTSQNTLSSGAIAGIAVAVAVAILSAGAAIFFYRRWKAALGTQNLYRLYTPPQGPTDLSSVAATGFSSSRDMRSNGSVLPNANDVLTRRAQQSPSDNTTQLDGIVQAASGSRDSRSITTNSPALSPVDEGPGRRPLPDAPGGGLSLTAEFPKLAQHRRATATDTTSIAPSDAPPPNYIQATGNAARE